MKKEEVVHLHKLLVHVKKCFEENGLDCDFQKYNELDITPLDMQGSKEEHKQAIFVLASEMASKAVSRNRDENRRRVVKGSSCAPASDKV
ncbi:MAG: UPF0058 family protein [Euryarchaeota archaeon]|nr:UPF0058 family protein [Euryarchaeota archaeon]